MQFMQAVMDHFEWGQYVLLSVVLGILALTEHFWPRRVTGESHQGRRRVNLLLYGLGGLLMWWVAEPVQTAAVRLGASLGWTGLAGGHCPMFPRSSSACCWWMQSSMCCIVLRTLFHFCGECTKCITRMPHSM